MLTMIGAGFLGRDRIKRYVDALCLRVVEDPSGAFDAAGVESSVDDEVGALHPVKYIPQPRIAHVLPGLRHALATGDPLDLECHVVVLPAFRPQLVNVAIAAVRDACRKARFETSGAGSVITAQAGP